MRTVLKKILTAMRGGVNELGEAVVEGQGNRILEQELRDSEHELKQANCCENAEWEDNLREPARARTHETGYQGQKSCNAGSRLEDQAGQRDDASVKPRQCTNCQHQDCCSRHAKQSRQPGIQCRDFPLGCLKR